MQLLLMSKWRLFGLQCPACNPVAAMQWRFQAYPVGAVTRKSLKCMLCEKYTPNANAITAAAYCLAQ